MPVTFEGKVISCGRQEGKLFWLPDPPVRVAVLKTEFVDAEVIHFKTVLSAAKEKLEKWYAMAVKEFGEKAADIFDMQLSILYDECSLTDSVVELIDTEHMSAEKAIEYQFGCFVQLLRTVGDKGGRERAAAAEELKQLLLSLALGIHRQRICPREDTILILQSLSAADMVSMDCRYIAGIGVLAGVTDEPLAFMAKQRKIPLVSELRDCRGRLYHGRNAVLDADAGLLLVRETKGGKECAEKIKKQV